MPDCGIIARFDAQLLLRMDLEGGRNVGGVHRHHKLHVAGGSCSRNKPALVSMQASHCLLTAVTTHIGDDSYITHKHGVRRPHDA